MNDTRIEPIMWSKIDGELMPEEQELLEKHFEEHPGDREHFSALEAFSDVLGKVEEIDAPPELRQRIDAGLDMASPARGLTFFARLRSMFLPDGSNALKFVAVAAGGFAVGVIGYHLVNYESLRNGSLDMSKIYGSMNVDTNSHRIIDIDLEGVQGTLRFDKRGSVIVSEIEIDSEAKVEVRIVYEGKSVRFGGIDPTRDPDGRITVDGNSVTLSNKGAGKYYVMIDVDPSAQSLISVYISSEGSVLLERRVDPAGL
ncbi:MAG: hypothetical protein O7D32_01525 [bacterium]|nr:hypothetical protein [bacterium]